MISDRFGARDSFGGEDLLGSSRIEMGVLRAERRSSTDFVKVLESLPDEAAGN